jgi:hypothetical protein
MVAAVPGGSLSPARWSGAERDGLLVADPR